MMITFVPELRDSDLGSLPHACPYEKMKANSC